MGGYWHPRPQQLAAYRLKETPSLSAACLQQSSDSYSVRALMFPASHGTFPRRLLNFCSYNSVVSGTNQMVVVQRYTVRAISSGSLRSNKNWTLPYNYTYTNRYGEGLSKVASHNYQQSFSQSNPNITKISVEDCFNGTVPVLKVAMSLQFPKARPPRITLFTILVLNPTIVHIRF
jgi:hypothetical protein